MSVAGSHPVCAGTAIEHVSGDWECTDSGCTLDLELHALSIRCDEVACRCTYVASRILFSETTDER